MQDNSVSYFITTARYFMYFLWLHTIVDKIYPYPNHDFKNKNKNIIELFNAGTNSIVCFNFVKSIIYFNNYNIDKVSGVNDTTIFSIQLLCGGLIYETFYYYVILGRKNQLVFIHHIYTIFTLFLNLYYNALHYYLCKIALVEVTNIFLSGLYIGKRNNLSHNFMLTNEVALLVSYLFLRILYLPYVFYELAIDFNYIYSIHPYPIVNGLFIIGLVWTMSIVWFQKLLVLFYNDRIKND